MSRERVILPEPIVENKSGPKGPDVAASFGEILTLTYWDRWCLLVAQQKFQGDLNLLHGALINQRLTDRFWSSFRKDAVEDLSLITSEGSLAMSDCGA